MRARTYTEAAYETGVTSVYLENLRAVAPSVELANALISKEASKLNLGEYRPIKARIIYKDRSYVDIKFHINIHDSKGFSLYHTLQDFSALCTPNHVN